MSDAESFHFESVEFVTVGTLGPRGQRAFFLQFRGDGRLVSLKIEKQQVSALADYLQRVLDDLPRAEPDESTADLSLREPVVPAWTVGSMGVAYVEEADQLILLAEELPIDDAPEEMEPAQARFALDRNQVAWLIERTRSIVAAGRPPCQFCGRPLETVNGDWCPCQN